MNQPKNELTQVPNRISTQIDQLRSMADRLDLLTDRNVRHARQLGFFDPGPSGGLGGQAPAPVVTTLEDAIQQLHRAIDNLDGSMNLFN